MASMNALSKGSLWAKCCGFIMLRICCGPISMGTCEIPNSSLYGLELLDLGLLGGDYVPRELIYLFVLSVPQRNARHSDCSLVVGDHRVDKAPI